MTKSLRLPACFDDPASTKMIENICHKHDIDVQLLRDLLNVTSQYSGQLRAHNITNEISVPIEDFLKRTESQ